MWADRCRLSDSCGRGSEQRGALEQTAVGEQVGRGSVGGYVAAGHDYGARTQVEREVEVVGGDDARVVERLYLAHEHAACAGIEVAGGFVHDEYVGLHGEHCGYGYAALLSAGELIAGPVLEVVCSDCFQGHVDTAVYFAVGQSHVDRAECDIVGHGGHEQLVVGVLEHESDCLAYARQGLWGDGNVADYDLALGGGEESVHVEHESRLSGTVGSYDGYLLAVRYEERYVVERPVAVGICVADVVEFYVVMAHYLRVRMLNSRERSASLAMAKAAAQAVRNMVSAADHRIVERIAALPSNPLESMAMCMRPALATVRTSSCPMNMPQSRGV